MSKTFAALILISMLAPQAPAADFTSYADWTMKAAPSAGVLDWNTVKGDKEPCAVAPMKVARNTAAQINDIARAVAPPAERAPTSNAADNAKASGLAQKLIDEAMYGTTCPTTSSGRKVCESVCRAKTSAYAWKGEKIADGPACAGRAQGRPSQLQCASWVRLALERAGIKPKGGGMGHAKDMGPGLTKLGFTKCNMKSRQAPPGAVIVYGGGAYGHVEIRTKNGYISDYWSATPRDVASGGTRPLKGVYVLGGCP